MSDAHEPIRRIFEEVNKRIDNKRWIRHAIVYQVRKKDKKIKVLLLPEKIKTGWLRVYWFNSLGSGQLPQVDSEVLLLLSEGHQDGAIVLAGGFADSPTEPSEDYEVEFLDKFGGKITMNSQGVTIDAGNHPLNIKGSQVKVNGGTLQVARVTDKVASPFGPLAIISGNTTFLA